MFQEGKAQAAPHQPGPVKVALIVGSGRSGTTLFERLLSRQEGWTSVGELVDIWQTGLVNNDRCGCQDPFGDCDFWRSVGDTAFGGWTSVRPRNMLSLKRSVERQRFLPLLIFPRLSFHFSTRLRKYADVMQTLYLAISTVSGANVIVDSSKWPIHALLLRQMPAVDLKVLHMVRDPRGVAASWKKRHVVRPHAVMGPAFMRSTGVFKTAINWIAFNAEARILRSLGIPAVTLRYEDFVRDPFGAVAMAANHIQGRDPEIDGVGLGELDMRLSHGLGGNPVRFRTGTVDLVQDTAWRRRLSTLEKLAVMVLAFPLMAAYGYLRRSSRFAPQRYPQRTREHWVGEAPDVSVIIPTRSRPTLLRRAIDSIVRQDYPGRIQCVVVFDQSRPDHSLEMTSDLRSVVVVPNTRTPGLPGARNSGLRKCKGSYIAFCDDDDEWLQGKLDAQMRLIRHSPGAKCAATGIYVSTARGLYPKVPSLERIDHKDLAKDRLLAINPCSLIVASDVVREVGLVDEQIPNGYGEDYDWLLRITSRFPIEVVRQPLVIVRWHERSWFKDRWANIDAAIEYLLDKHPDLASSRIGYSRLISRRAIAKAAMGEKGAALRLAVRAVWLNPLQKRCFATFAILAGVLDVGKTQEIANRFGRGL